MDIKNIKLYYHSFKTKIGDIYYIWYESASDTNVPKTVKEDFFINFIGLGEDSFNNYIDRIVKNFYKSEPVIIENQNKYTEIEIIKYLEGKSKAINLKPYFLFGSSFEKAVWLTLLKIPFGKTMSYTEVSALSGKPKACRAAGTAVGKNPLLLLVPCHRVIKSSGGIGGFSSGVDIKKFLLELESSQG